MFMAKSNLKNVNNYVFKKTPIFNFDYNKSDYIIYQYFFTTLKLCSYIFSKFEISLVDDLLRSKQRFVKRFLNFLPYLYSKKDFEYSVVYRTLKTSINLILFFFKISFKNLNLFFSKSKTFINSIDLKIFSKFELSSVRSEITNYCKKIFYNNLLNTFFLKNFFFKKNDKLTSINYFLYSNINNIAPLFYVKRLMLKIDYITKIVKRFYFVLIDGVKKKSKKKFITSLHLNSKRFNYVKNKYLKIQNFKNLYKNSYDVYFSFKRKLKYGIKFKTINKSEKRNKIIKLLSMYFKLKNLKIKHKVINSAKFFFNFFSRIFCFQVPIFKDIFFFNRLIDLDIIKINESKSNLLFYKKVKVSDNENFYKKNYVYKTVNNKKFYENKSRYEKKIYYTTNKKKKKIYLNVKLRNTSSLIKIFGKDSKSRSLHLFNRLSSSYPKKELIDYRVFVYMGVIMYMHKLVEKLFKKKLFKWERKKKKLFNISLYMVGIRNFFLKVLFSNKMITLTTGINKLPIFRYKKISTSIRLAFKKFYSNIFFLKKKSKQLISKYIVYNQNKSNLYFKYLKSELYFFFFLNKNNKLNKKTSLNTDYYKKYYNDSFKKRNFLNINFFEKLKSKIKFFFSKKENKNYDKNKCLEKLLKIKKSIFNNKGKVKLNISAYIPKNRFHDFYHKCSYIKKKVKKMYSLKKKKFSFIFANGKSFIQVFLKLFFCGEVLFIVYALNNLYVMLKHYIHVMRNNFWVDRLYLLENKKNIYKYINYYGCLTYKKIYNLIDFFFKRKSYFKNKVFEV